MGGHGRSKYATRCCTTADHTFQQCILGFKFAVQNLSCACRRHRPRVKPRDLETRMNNRKHPKKQSQEKGIFREKMWEWCATCATQHSVQFESFNLALSLCTLMDIETQSLQSSGKRVSVYCPVDPGNASPFQIVINEADHAVKIKFINYIALWVINDIFKYQVILRANYMVLDTLF